MRGWAVVHAKGAGTMKRRAVVRWVALGGLAFALASCVSKAGPFVTGVSSDGKGGLVIEKCMVRLDRFLTTVENSDCIATAIQLGGEKT